MQSFITAVFCDWTIGYWTFHKGDHFVQRHFLVEIFRNWDPIHETHKITSPSQESFMNKIWILQEEEVVGNFTSFCNECYQFYYQKFYCSHLGCREQSDAVIQGPLLLSGGSKSISLGILGQTIFF